MSQACTTTWVWDSFGIWGELGPAGVVRFGSCSVHFGDLLWSSWKLKNPKHCARQWGTKIFNFRKNEVRTLGTGQ